MLSKFSDHNLIYVLTILEAIEKINIYTKNIDSDVDFFEQEEQKTFNAVCHLLLAVGEETKKIDDKLKDNFLFINWEQIAAVRNRIAHDYRGLDYEIVYRIAKVELKPLKDVLIEILKFIDIDKNILSDYLSSQFYRNIQYLKNKE